MSPVGYGSEKSLKSPSRPQLSEDLKKPPSTDVFHPQNEYADAVKRWHDF